MLASATMTRFLSIVCAIALAGCFGPYTRVTPLNPSPRPVTPRPAMAVEMYTTNTPTRPYVETASLEWNDSTAARERAGQLGCDALVVVRQGSGSVLSAGTCVVWNDQPATAAGPPATVAPETAAPPATP